MPVFASTAGCLSSSSIPNKAAVYLFGIENHFFFSGQFFLNFSHYQLKMGRVSHVIQVIRGYDQAGAQAEPADPALVQCVDLLQVVRADLAFIIAAAMLDTRL